MPNSLEECRLAMLAFGLMAIPVALIIEWASPRRLSPKGRSRSTRHNSAGQPPARTAGYQVRVTPGIKSIHKKLAGNPPL